LVAAAAALAARQKTALSGLRGRALEFWRPFLFFFATDFFY
jgi:hypothetical protein